MQTFSENKGEEIVIFRIRRVFTLSQKGSGLSRKIDKKRIAKYNLEQKNFTVQHLHEETVITAKSIGGRN